MKTPRTMREVNLYPPVKRWLQSQGYRVHPEQAGHDVAAIRDSDQRIIVVELKMCLSRGVCYQITRARWADARYAAVASKPRSLELPKQYGFGVLRVSGESVEVLLESQGDPNPLNEPYNARWHAKWVERLSSAEPPDVDVAGLPTLAGNGPAIRCAKRVQEYLKSNPNASWKQIYKEVPNHYAHYRSLQGAMPSREYLLKPPEPTR